MEREREREKMEIKFQSTRLKTSYAEVLPKSTISRTMPCLRDAMLHMCYNFIALISGTTNVRARDLL